MVVAGVDHAREMLGAAIREVVAIDRRDDDVIEAHLPDGFGDARRLVGIERHRHAGRDVAEGAGAGADLAHDHEGGVLLVPALADIRAAGFLADRHEIVGLNDAAGFGVSPGVRRLDADPVRLAQDILVRPVGLLGMARPRCGGDGV